MNDIKTIEQKVAETILQTPEEVTIGGRKYSVAPPSTATLILVSEAVSRLPAVSPETDKIVEYTLAFARDCRPLGEIVAIMILGARGLECTEKVKELRLDGSYLFGLFKQYREVEVERRIDKKSELAKELLETLSPSELHELTATLLKKMQIADFFGLTTFLTEINMLRQTKVEEEEN